MRAEVTTIRIDPVVQGAITRLGEMWGVYDRRTGRINRSEVIRRSVLFTYFVMNGIDPSRANELAREAMKREIAELGEFGLKVLLDERKKRLILGEY